MDKPQQPKTKLVIGLASIWAGGGHNALRDFLKQELDQVPDFDCYSFTHSDESYNQFNDAVLGRVPDVFNSVYQNVPNDYAGLSALKLVEECEQFVREVNPDMVISSNFGVSCAFGLIKKTLKLNFVNVYAIPDYGKTGSAAFPTNRYFSPDHVLVFDALTRDGLVRDLGYPKNKVTLSGSIARRSFRALVARNKDKSRTELVKEIHDYLQDKAPGISIAPEKNTALITGGAGGIIDKAHKLLKALANYQKDDPEYRQTHQFLVITGQHKKYFQKLFKLNQNDPAWSNIIPIPWVEHEVFVKLQLLSEFPILITIAPATVNELIETHCGPFLVHHRRSGPEQANLEFALAQKLCVYLPKVGSALEKILSGFKASEKQNFLKRARQYTLIREKRLQKLPNVVRSIYRTNCNPKRAGDKKRLSFKMDLDLISPKVLLTIFMLALPASLIHTYARYYEQKHKWAENTWVKAFSETTSKWWKAWNDNL